MATRKERGRKVAVLYKLTEKSELGVAAHAKHERLDGKRNDFPLAALFFIILILTIRLGFKVGSRQD